MFQSDDFDEALADSLFSFSENEYVKKSTDICSSVSSTEESLITSLNDANNHGTILRSVNVEQRIRSENRPNSEADTPKRKKRKFPGPAGLLPDSCNGKMSEINNTIQSSQDYASSQNRLPLSVFEEGPWCVMKDELKSYGRASTEYCISQLKNQAISHKLVGQRVPLLGAVIQNIDHSSQYPSIILRDRTDEIQGTIHRDAWDTYSCYLVPQYSAILLKNIAILTTGNLLKKNYLNITLNNIVAVYCDDDNSYLQKEQKKLARIQKENNCKTCNIDTILWNSMEIIVLRNKSIIQESSKRDCALQTSKNDQSPNGNQDNPDEAIARDLLSGMDPNALFEDFE